MQSTEIRKQTPTPKISRKISKKNYGRAPKQKGTTAGRIVQSTYGME